MARDEVLEAGKWAKSTHMMSRGSDGHDLESRGVALRDCARLYDESEIRLSRLLVSGDNYTADDARTWLSGVMASHRTCLDGLVEMDLVQENLRPAKNLTSLLAQALALYNRKKSTIAVGRGKQGSYPNEGILTSWNPRTSKSDMVVAKDGSGTHRTINEALTAVGRMGHTRPRRVIIYVKAGVYKEKVEINNKLRNIMFVGDGMDQTIVTADRNVPDGATTFSSATFGVSGDGFWARDMTFENTAGPQKHQAVALRVGSDHSIFYRCSFNGYQDTLFVHSLRQFYRDCHVYGTIDFIFGDAVAVFQNCDIFLRRPMSHQANMITAQGRDSSGENTGISIQGSRVRPAPEFVPVRSAFKSYLGRPWKKYSRTIFWKTYLDGLIHPKGWTEWSGSFALSTLYYAEYMNTGVGATTRGRVRWPGFHVLNSPQQVSAFTVSNFIQGQSWIPISGVPFWAGIN